MTEPDPLDELDRLLHEIRTEIDEGLELVAKAKADRAQDGER